MQRFTGEMRRRWLTRDVRGRGYQPKGQTPVAYAVGGKRHKLSMISTVTNQGKTRWMIVDEAFNSDKLIEFLQALVKDADKKIFLILDNEPVKKPVLCPHQFGHTRFGDQI